MSEGHDSPGHDADALDEREGRVLCVHFGHSANCSSVGSIVDFLFLSGVAGAAVVSAVAVVLHGRARRAGTLSDDEAARPDETTSADAE